MPKTVIGLFDDYLEAQEVLQDLVDDGFEGDRISTITEAEPGVVTTTEHGAGGMSAPLEDVAAALAEMGMPQNKARYYAEAVRRGGTLVCVTAEDQQADKAASIIDGHGSVDINNRAGQWRQTGWAGFSSDGKEGEVVVLGTTCVIAVPSSPEIRLLIALPGERRTSRSPGSARRRPTSEGIVFPPSVAWIPKSRYLIIIGGYKFYGTAIRVLPKGVAHAVDHLCHPADSLGLGNGQLVYPGRVHSSTIASRAGRSADQNHRRQKTRLKIDSLRGGPLSSPSARS
jgi:hypothetical protein